MITPGLDHPGLGTPREDVVRDVLEELRAHAGARLAMVVDRTGALLVLAGEPGALDGAGFASLSAAHLHGHRQLATLVGESEFTGLSHLGNRTSVHIADVADAAILALLYDGVWSSEQLHTASREIAARLESPIRSMLAPGRNDGGAALFGPDWAVEAEDEIDRIFRETC